MKERLGRLINNALTSAGKQKLSIGLEWEICPSADRKCEGAKDPETFEELCSKGQYTYCSNFIINYQPND